MTKPRKSVCPWFSVHYCFMFVVVAGYWAFRSMKAQPLFAGIGNAYGCKYFPPVIVSDFSAMLDLEVRFQKILFFTNLADRLPNPGVAVFLKVIKKPEKFHFGGS